MRNERLKNGEKWCSYGDHWVRISKFRKSQKGKHLPLDASGHYITYCRECESKQASIRQAKNYKHKRGPRMADKYQGVEIQRLPTVGEAYSMKTRSQGRQTSISEELREERIIKRKMSFRKDRHIWEANAKRILSYAKATAGQKKVAADFLSERERMGDKETVIYYRLGATIQGIVRTLCKKDKAF